MLQDYWNFCTKPALKSKPCEKFLVNFCTSALMKAGAIAFFTLTRLFFRALKSAEVQKFARKFSCCLDFSV